MDIAGTLRSLARRLAGGGGRRSVMMEIARQSDAMTRKDIAAWRAAWRRAASVESPSRRLLYEVYADVDADLHLSGCVMQRTAMALSRTFALRRPDGTADAAATETLNRPWFKEFLRLALQSIYWGHSLIELGDVVAGPTGPEYDGARLVPRAHVSPEFHTVMRHPADDPRGGLDYTADPWAPWLVEAGRPDDLGLYLKAAAQTIPKKHAMAFWDAFAEVFGMPMRVAKTTSRDAEEHRRLTDAMASLGNKAYAVMDADTDVSFVETSRADAFQVYNARVELADREISKLIIGQTMTIEDGSSLSQSQTHLRVFMNLVEQDCDMLRDLVNSRLLPRMAAHGFPVGGLSFEWEYQQDYTPEQQMQYEAMVADRYDVEPEYFAAKYGMPVGQRREAGPAPAAGGGRFFF